MKTDGAGKKGAVELLAFEDPNHPGNGEKYRTGELCVICGKEPAGTAWSHLFCFPCNAKRIKRVSVAFEQLELDADEAEYRAWFARVFRERRPAGVPRGAPIRPTRTLEVCCDGCRHVWKAIDFHMPADRVRRLFGPLHCPKCGKQVEAEKNQTGGG